MSHIQLVIAIFLPILIFCIASYLESKNAKTPITFLQYGTGYRSPSFFATLLASNSSLSGALYLIAFYGFLYGANIFLWVFVFWFSTQIMSYYTIKWVDSIDGEFIHKRGTLHEFLALIFGKNINVRIIAAKISLFTYIGLLACEIVIGYGIISSIIKPETIIYGKIALEPLFALFLVLGLVAGYCTLAGFRGVVRTDEFQLILILLMMISLAFYLKSSYLIISLIVFSVISLVSFFMVRKKKLPENIKQSASNELSMVDVLKDLPKQKIAIISFIVITLVWYFSSVNLGHEISFERVINPVQDSPVKFVMFFVIANVIFWLVWWPSAMDQWHRCAATTDSRVGKHWLLGTLGAIPVLYLGLLSLVFLFVGAHVGILSPDSTDPLAAILELIQRPEALESSFGTATVIFVTMGLVAAMISTCDSYLVVASQSWVCDARESKRTGFSLWQSENQDSSKKISMGILRSSVGILFVSAMLLSLPLMLFLTDVFAAIYFFFSGMLVIAGVLLTGFIIKDRNKRDASGEIACNALKIGMIYVVISNILIISMLELCLNNILNGNEWYFNAGNWYYAVYFNPVMAMGITFFFSYFKAKIKKGIVND